MRASSDSADGEKTAHEKTAGGWKLEALHTHAAIRESEMAAPSSVAPDARGMREQTEQFTLPAHSALSLLRAATLRLHAVP